MAVMATRQQHRIPKINLLSEPVQKTATRRGGLRLWVMIAVAASCWLLAILAVAMLLGWRP